MENIEKDQVSDFFSKEYNKTLDLKEKIRNSMRESSLQNLKQRREFYQNLILLLGAIIGIAAFWGVDKLANATYFEIGVCIYILFVLLVTFYFREVIDKEGNLLHKQGDEIDFVIGEKQKLLSKYIKSANFTYIAKSNFWKELRDIPTLKKLKEEVANNEDNRNKRIKGEYSPDYTGEVFVSFFVFSSLFIILSIFFKNINLFAIILVSIILIVLIFMNSATFFIKLVNKILNSVVNIYKNK